MKQARRLTYRELVDEMKADVKAEHGTLRARDDDWGSLAYLQRPDTLYRLPILSSMLASSDAKAAMAALFADMIEAGGVTIFGMRMTMYFVAMNPTQLTDDERRVVLERYEIPARIPAPSEHPERREALVLLVADAERVEHWTAPIRRRRYGRPLLGEWESRGRDTVGPIIDPIIEALR